MANKKYAYFFHADWCKPCQRTKPVWENVKRIYESNDIMCIEYHYDTPNTKSIMESMGVKTIPTLVVYDGYNEIYRGDSETIPNTSMSVVGTFSLEEDF